jgi:hypothetical protein
MQNATVLNYLWYFFQPERTRLVVESQYGLHNFLFSVAGGNVQRRPAPVTGRMQRLRSTLTGQRQIQPCVIL